MKKNIILFVVGIQVSALAGWTGCYSQTNELMKHYPDGRTEPAGITQVTYLKLEENHRISSFSTYSTQENQLWPQSGVWFEKDKKVYYFIKLDGKFHIGKLTGTPSKTGILEFKDCSGRFALAVSKELKRIPPPTFSVEIPDDELGRLLKQLEGILTDYPEHDFEGMDSEKAFMTAIQDAVKNRDAKKMLAMTYFDPKEGLEINREQVYFCYTSICLDDTIECKPYENGEKHVEYVSKKYGFPDGASSIKVLLINTTLLPYGKMNGKWCFINQREKK